jgi:hypothetical protein
MTRTILAFRLLMYEEELVAAYFLGLGKMAAFPQLFYVRPEASFLYQCSAAACAPYTPFPISILFK